jgi:formamidopyrimidine-DNA glycosylase
MPELPEVEVTRLSFVEAISGASIQGLSLGKLLRWPLGCEPQTLVGRKVLSVRRRGKYLLLDLDQGMLLIHLGMSGSLRFAQQMPPAGSHDHFDLSTTKGVLRLHDPRRFGAVVFAPSESDPVAQKLLGHLGMEPLSNAFRPDAFATALKARRVPIKSVLLAGHVVVGVGNIYASEALFMAGIRPTVLSHRIGIVRVQRLHSAIVQVLSRAVAAGGTTLRDFSSTDGTQGHFQHETQVYGRAGLPCRVCASTVQGFKQGQRSTYFCPQCQRH